MHKVSANSKIFKHPDKDEITEKLLSGESLQSVADWLKSKYPKRKKFWISYLTLQSYRKFHLNLEGEVLKEIKEQNRQMELQRLEEKEAQTFKNNEQYQKVKKRVAENLLNVNEEILKIHDKVWERIHILEQQAIKHQNDRVITELLSQARSLLVDYSNMLKQQEDSEKNKGTTVNIQFKQQVDQKVGAMKQAIRKTLQIMAPELIPTFLENLRNEFDALEKGDDSNAVEVQVK